MHVQLCHWKFSHKKKLCSRHFRQKLNFYWPKQQNRVLCHPLRHLGVTYTVHLWLVEKRVVDFLLFLQLSRLRRYEQILVKIEVFETGLGHFVCKFQGEGGHPPTILQLLASKTTVPGLSSGPTFSHFDIIPACDAARVLK